jgi:hypothetical protein
VASAGHPFYLNVLGAHVHVGSLYDLAVATKLRTALARHAPALIALSTACPVMEERVGEFKSWRVAERAHGCANPLPVTDPTTTRVDWGEDACIKVWAHATMELRLFDAPIHPCLYLEMAILGAGLVAGVHRRLGRATPRLTRADGEAYLLDRLTAARDGLQATFIRDDDEVPATDAVEEALEIADEGMAELGLPAADLVWIPKLLEGRVTQADYLLELYERCGDPWAYLSHLAAISEEPGAFERWLEAGPTREARPPRTIRDTLLACVDGHARVRDANRWLQLPATAFEREMRALERDGELVRIEDPERGLRFGRPERRS